MAAAAMAIIDMRAAIVRLSAFTLVILGLLLAAAIPARADPPIPALTGRIVDLAGVLDASTIASLTQRLADEEASTSNQVVVVTLPDLKGYTIEQWGGALLNGWGIGQRDKNNGVVLVVAPKDRQLRIEVGYGLEGTLSNRAAADIIQNEMVPRFKGGDMKGGITAGVDAILATIAGTYQGPSVEASGRGGSDVDFKQYLPFIAFPAAFFAIVGLRLWFRSRAPRQIGSASRRRYDDDDDDDDGENGLRRNRRSPRRFSQSGSAFGERSSGGSSGGGGRGGGGGASGRW